MNSHPRDQEDETRQKRFRKEKARRKHQIVLSKHRIAESLKTLSKARQISHP